MRLLVALVAATGIVLAAQGRPAATISGVVEDSLGVGVGGVDVRVAEDAGSGLFAGRTDGNGRFSVSRLPPGRFVVTAMADGFLPTTYGAMAHGEPGIPIRLDEAGRADPIRITLERPASLAGRVTSVDGEPVPSAVHAMAVSWLGPRQSLRRVATARSLPDGRYMLSGLTPGPYLVLATPLSDGREGASEPSGEGREPTAYRHAFYPGVPAAVYAATVTVSAGEEAVAIDVLVDRVPVTSLEASPVRDGQPLAYPALVLVPQEIGEVGLQVDTSPVARPLRFERVPAGRYDVVASALEAAPNGVLERLWARAVVDVDGRTPVDVPLGLGPGARIEGRLVSGGGASPIADLPETWLWPFDADYPSGILPFGGTLVAAPTGEFTISGIAPGRYVLQFGRDRSSQVAGWSNLHFVIAGQDLADLPIDLRPGDRYTDVEVVLSNRTSELRGTLSGRSGEPRSDVTLVAFPIDSRYWWTGTRRIRLARPDTSGVYVIRGLPEGEYFLAAVTGRLPAEPTDPQWLGGLAGASVRVLVSDGGRTVQDLRVGSR